MSTQKETKPTPRMTVRERKEYVRLQNLWAAGLASGAQILRCMELDMRAALAKAEEGHNESR